MKSNFYAALRRLAAVMIGIVFYAAGMLKLDDPVGAGLKVGDYLNYFHIGFLGDYSKLIGVSLAMVEAIIGALLCSGVFRKFTSWVTGLFLVAFTIITAILWAENPSMDCGCFGEAVKLTHAQSFFKNLVMCALAAFAFLPYNDMEQPRKVKYSTFAITVLCIIGLGVYSTNHLPLIDFSELSSGSRIISTIQIESGEEDPDDGIVLNLVDPEGWSIDNRFIRGRHLAICVNDPEGLTQREWTEVNAVAEDAYASGVRPVILIPGGDFSAIPGYINADAFSIDPRKLITLNRQNAGLTYIGGGVVVKKWELHDAPSIEDFSELAQFNSVMLAVENGVLPGTVFQMSVIVPLALMILI